jgi:hypothetical protein
LLNDHSDGGELIGPNGKWLRLAPLRLAPLRRSDQAGRDVSDMKKVDLLFEGSNGQGLSGDPGTDQGGDELVALVVCSVIVE